MTATDSNDSTTTDAALLENPAVPAKLAGQSRLEDGPRGTRPRRAFSARNIMLYGTLIVIAMY